MKLKRILSLVCIGTLLLTNISFAANNATLGEKTAQLSASLSAGGNATHIIGEVTMLIAENDVFNILTQKGAVIQTASLKKAADDALKSPDTGSASALLTQLRLASDVISGAVAPASFADVSAGSWYYDAVIYSVSNGIFKGMSETQFAPDMEITRGMFLTLMGRMYKSDSVKYAKGYSDVEDGAYYADAVNWAKKKGILSFIEGDMFYPNKPITREELVTVLRGSMAAYGKDTDYMVQMKSFTDAKSISSWAKDSVSWAMAKKVVTGFEDGSFRPQATATRAQVAQIFYNQR